MGRLKTITRRFDGAEEIKVKYDVYVNSEGEFTTTLPIDIVRKLEDAKINLNHNRSRNAGFFCDDTLGGLHKQISECIKSYQSKTPIKEEIIIRYSINTLCSYCIEDGEIFPNGSWCDFEKTGWSGGTIDTHAAHQRPIGFDVFAEPKKKVTYQWKSGKTTSEYENIEEYDNLPEKGDKDYYLHWLDSVCSAVPNREGKCKEIEYTEDIAKFFVDMIVAVCQINERIKDFLEPEQIKEIVEKKIKFLN